MGQISRAESRIRNSYQAEAWDNAYLEQYKDLLNCLKPSYHNPRKEIMLMPVIPILDPTFDIGDSFKIKAPISRLGNVVRVEGDLGPSLWGTSCNVYFEGGFVEYFNQMVAHTPSLYCPTAVVFYGAVDAEFNEVPASIPYRHIYTYDHKFEWDAQGDLTRLELVEREILPDNSDIHKYWENVQPLPSGENIENFQLTQYWIRDPFKLKPRRKILI